MFHMEIHSVKTKALNNLPLCTDHPYGFQSTSYNSTIICENKINSVFCCFFFLKNSTQGNINKPKETSTDELLRENPAIYTRTTGYRLRSINFWYYYYFYYFSFAQLFHEFVFLLFFYTCSIYSFCSVLLIL